MRRLVERGRWEPEVSDGLFTDGLRGNARIPEFRDEGRLRMTVLVRQLRKDGLYYKVVTAGIPKIDLVVDTWVFLRKEGPDYLFCNWWDYFRHDFATKHGRPSSNRPLRHRPDTDPVTGEPAFHEFCKRADLASWIEQVTERMDKEEKVEEPDDEARKRPKHKAR